MLTTHVSHNSGENEWYTPSQYIEAAEKTMGSIDLDPASTEIANRVVGAKTFFTEEDDGLKKEWTGNIWLNPPYAQPLIKYFSEKVCETVEKDKFSNMIILVNNATETTWFQDMSMLASAICFTNKRIKFLDPEGNPGAPLQGQTILYFGSEINLFFNEFNR